MASCSTSGGVKGDESTGPDYNESNVKRGRLNSTLAALLDDPILADVPRKPSLSDVDTLISLELGSAMRISVLKMDATSFDVPVMNSATVKDLKLAVKKKVNESEQSKMGHRHISWRHVWGNYCLSYHNEKLLDDDAVLQDYGIRNNSQEDNADYLRSKACSSVFVYALSCLLVHVTGLMCQMGEHDSEHLPVHAYALCPFYPPCHDKDFSKAFKKEKA